MNFRQPWLTRCGKSIKILLMSSEKTEVIDYYYSVILKRKQSQYSRGEEMQLDWLVTLHSTKNGSLNRNNNLTISGFGADGRSITCPQSVPCNVFPN
jgi:hypothetical protein